MGQAGGGSRAFAILFVFALVVRLFVPATALDRLYNYDLVGGAGWMKIHPGSYLIFACALFALVRRRAPLSRPSRGAIKVLLGMVAVCGLSCILRGSTTALGLLVDNPLCAAAGLLCLTQLDAEGKRLAVHAVLAGMGLNALLIFYEFFSRTTLFKSSVLHSAYFFRPSGLLNHPLDNGLYLTAAIAAASLIKQPLPTRVGLALLFFLATLGAGARVASIIALPTLLASFAAAARDETGASAKRQRMALLALAFTALALPLAVGVALGGGMGYRFAGALFDVSARTRLNVYALLTHLDPKTLMLGVGVDRMTLYAANLLNERVESPLVVAIFMFGLPLGLLYLGAMIYALYEGAKTGDLRVRLIALAFVVVGADNGVFVSKTPALLYALVLVYGALAFLPQTKPAFRSVSDADRRRAAYAARRLRPYPSPGARAFSEKA